MGKDCLNLKSPVPVKINKLHTLQYEQKVISQLAQFINEYDNLNKCQTCLNPFYLHDLSLLYSLNDGGHYTSPVCDECLKEQEPRFNYGDAVGGSILNYLNFLINKLNKESIGWKKQ